MKTEVVDDENEDVREINDRICCGGADGSRDPSWHSGGLIFAFLGGLIVAREKQVGFCSN
jgi:hypothetical protein